MANKVKGKGSTRQNFLYSVYFVALCSFKTIIDPPSYIHTHGLLRVREPYEVFDFPICLRVYD
jgi:hypothetical protein